MTNGEILRNCSCVEKIKNGTGLGNDKRIFFENFKKILLLTKWL
ncbi:hypothetical protein BACI9J_60482 [Bacillus altitudinis]|nr:hypothetical protein BACI9J_60482 [Bacillus altitudinis]